MSASRCGFIRSMQHLISANYEEDVTNEPTIHISSQRIKYCPMGWLLEDFGSGGKPPGKDLIRIFRTM